MNNEKIENIKPLIFTKKINEKYHVRPVYFTDINDKYPLKSVKYIRNTLGPTRHFPPAIKEWFNSIYCYNNNSIKNLSIADKNLTRLIKSYFNLYFSKKVLKSKRIAIRFRRLAINKIFISKTELKHTTSKVVITLYVYNEERRILTNRIKRLEALLFPSSKILSSFSRENKNKLLSLKEKLYIIKDQEENIPLITWLERLKSYIVEQIKLEEDTLYRTKNLKIRKYKILLIENLKIFLENLLHTIAISEKDSLSYKYYENIYTNFVYKTHLEKEIMIISYYKLLLNLNKSKFEDKFLLNLKPLISKIYNKEVEFNIVNLKTLYLNSDIFTQVIALKLKNRNNKLLNVLRSSLYMLKLPKVNKIREQFNNINIKELWVNKVKNLKVSSINNIYNKDSLNQVMLDLFHVFFKKEEQEISCIYPRNYKVNNNSSLLNFILNSLKHKDMAGARLEAKGRLTRRFTAARSVFKIKWKGSLKNIDSSYRGLSSVILRGHVKSNVQYSIINSKTRNGAFGLKGWISSK